jgi:CheY-like chemotaxis protein
MTAHAMLGDRERCLESGMDFYVSKSINPMELTAFLSGVKTQWIAGGSPQAGV